MTSLSNLAKQNLSSIFKQRDRKKRQAAVRALWAPDGVLSTADGVYVGHRAVEEAAASVLRRYPEFDFQLTGEIDEIPSAARMRWLLGAAGFGPGAKGLDVVAVVSGRIVAMYRFLDGAEL